MLKNSLIKSSQKNNLIKVNLTALSKKIGRSLTWTSLVWNRKVKSRKTQELIAEALGIPYEELWGKEKGQISIEVV